MQQQTTVLSTSGSYLSPSVAFPPCHIQQIGAVSLNGLPATPIAPASGESSFPEASGQAGSTPTSYLTLSPSSGLHSPPLLGTAAVPGLVAPIPNGFPGVLPFPGSHPALETVYANGLVPYPGNFQCLEWAQQLGDTPRSPQHDIWGRAGPGASRQVREQEEAEKEAT